MNENVRLSAREDAPPPIETLTGAGAEPLAGPYEAPCLTPVGSLRGLLLAKKTGPTDGEVPAKKD